MVVTAKLACILLLVSFFAYFAPTVWAQELSGVAINIDVADLQAGEGDILSISKEGLKRSSVEFDMATYGVIVTAPVLSIEPRTDSSKAVVTSGFAKVKVDGAEEIKVGDFITTSATAGVGKKATKSGYILGKALADYNDKSKTGLIPVEVTIGYVDIGGGGTLSGDIISRLLVNIDSKDLGRYILAALVGLVTFAVATYAFARFISTGIVALGRNPMARGTIMSGMVISSLVIAAIAVSGFGVALAIINFKLPFFG